MAKKNATAITLKKFQHIKRQQFIDDMFLHKLRSLDDIYRFYGGTCMDLKSKRSERLYQECALMLDRLKRRKVVYKRGGYKGERGGWHVSRWYPSFDAMEVDFQRKQKN